MCGMVRCIVPVCGGFQISVTHLTLSRPKKNLCMQGFVCLIPLFHLRSVLELNVIASYFIFSC